MTTLLHSGARTHHQDQPMIPASFSAIRGITARGSWPGSDSRHDDPCPLVTLRGYPAGGSPNQREPSREKSVLLISATPTGFHFHDLRHTGNTLAGAAGASLRERMERMGHSTTRAALIYQHRTSERDKLIADAMGKLAKAELRQRGRPSGAQRVRKGKRAS
jgi:integrase